LIKGKNYLISFFQIDLSIKLPINTRIKFMTNTTAKPGIQVFAGISKVADMTSENAQSIEAVIYHRNYTQDFGGYDIAVVKLDKEFELKNGSVEVVKIPASDPKVLPDNCRIAGWGGKSENSEYFKPWILFAVLGGKDWFQRS